MPLHTLFSPFAASVMPRAPLALELTGGDIVAWWESFKAGLPPTDTLIRAGLVALIIFIVLVIVIKLVRRDGARHRADVKRRKEYEHEREQREKTEDK